MRYLCKILIFITFIAVAIAMSLQAVYAETLEEQLNNLIGPRQLYNTMVSPNYIRNNISEEYVNPQTGELHISQVDYVLTGRNGLDLEIKRLYKSGMSYLHNMKARYVNGAWVDYWESDVESSSFYEDRYNLGVGWRFSFPTIEIKKNSDGTSFNYLHTESGDIYRLVNSTDGTYTLENHFVKDLTVKDDVSFSHSGRVSKYVMIEKDGKKTYFDSDGRILGIVDRYGNKITFEYSEISYKIDGYTKKKTLITKITDTIGRVVNIEYKQDENFKATKRADGSFPADLQNKFDVIIYLPDNTPANLSDNKKIIYNRSGFLFSSTSGKVIRTRLSNVYDIDGVKKYWFEVEQLGPYDGWIKPGIGFTYTRGNKYSVYNGAENINAIGSNKSNKRTEYTYGTYTKWFGDTGSIQYRKVIKKRDIEISWDGTNVNESVKNSLEYTYTGEPDGYPKVLSYENDYSSDIPLKINYGDGSGRTSGSQYVIKAYGDYWEFADKLDLSNVAYEIDLLMRSFFNSSIPTEASLLFRVDPNTYYNKYYCGYYVSLDCINDKIILGKSTTREYIKIKEVPYTLDFNVNYHIKIEALDTSIKVYVNDMEKPVLTASDSTYTKGTFGIKFYNSFSHLDNLRAYENGCTYYTIIKDMRGVQKKYSYNAIGQLISSEDYGNDHKEVTNIKYGSNRMPMKKETLTYNVVNGVPGTNPVKNVENFTYDEYGNLISYTGPLGTRNEEGNPVDDKYTVSYEYYIDKFHMLKSKKSKINDTLTSIVNYEVDDKGSIIKQTKVHKEGNVDKSIITEYLYDYNDSINTNDFGNVIKKRVKVNDAIMYNTFYEYGIDADNTNHNGAYLTREYTDISGSQLSKRYVYDYYTGNLKAFIDEYNNRTNYEYDDLLRIKKISYNNSSFTKEFLYEDIWFNNKVVKYKDQNGWWHGYYYDIYNNQTEYKCGNNSSTSTSIKRYEYDSSGNLIKEVNSLGHSTRYYYDSANRLVKKSYYENDSIEKEFMTLKYETGVDSSTPLRVTITDEDGYITKYYYDKIHRVVKEEGTPDNKNFFSMTYEYDYAGNLIKSTNRRGFTTNFEYDDQNRLITKIDASKEKVKYTYDCLDQVKTIEEPGKKVTEYTYDPRRRPFSISIYEEGKSTDYYKLYTYYDPPNANVIPENKVTIKEGKYIDGDSYISSEVTYIKDCFGNITDEYKKIDSARKSHTKYEYDGNGNIKVIKEYIDSTETKYKISKFDYDAFGNMTLEEGWVENEGTRGYYKKMYEYDDLGNLKEFKELNDSDYNMTSYIYDHRNRIKEKTEPFGTNSTRTTQYNYDKRGNLTSEKITVDGVVCETKYEYDGFGNKIRVTDALGKTTRYVFDVNCNLVKLIDPRYYTIGGEKKDPNIINTACRKEFEYDAQDRHVKTKVVDSTGAFVVVEYKEYDGRGNLTKEVDGEGYSSTNESNSIGYRYYYDVADNLIKIISPATAKYNNDNGKSEATKIYTYDGSGRVLTEVDANVFTGEFVGKNTTTYSYYLNGQLKEKIYPDGLKESYNYDLTGNMEITKTDRAKNKTKYYNTVFNKPFRIEYPDNTYEEYEYTGTGNISKHKNKRGYEKELKYDKNNNLIETKQMFKSDVDNTYYLVSKYEYNEVNLLTKKETFTLTKNIRTSNENLTSNQDAIKYTYDKVGRIRTIEGPYNRYVEYAYDDNGNVNFEKKLVSTGNYDIKRYEYNVSNQLSKEITLLEAVNVDPAYMISGMYDSEYNTKVKAVTEFTYYKNGKLKTKTEPYGDSTRYEYDYDGRMIKSTEDKLKRTVEYSYDLRGNLIKIINARLKATSFEYDSMNRVIRVKTPVSDDTIAVTRYIYDNMGNLKKEIKPKYYEAAKDTPGLVESMKGMSYTYDSMNRLVSIKSPDGELITIRKYDQNGNLSKEVDGLRCVYTSNGEPDMEKSKGSVYEYNSMDKVVKITDALGNYVTYEYDALGRMVKNTDAKGKITAYEYYPDSTLMKVTYPDNGVIEYTYDKLGRKIKEKDQRNNSTLYSYNEFGSITKITDPLNKTIENKYDLKGNITSQKDKRGNISYFSYYSDNRLKEKKTPIEDNNGTILYAIEQYEYDGNGNIIKKTQTGTKNPSSKRVTEYTYYSNDVLNTVTDNSGAYTKNHYDKNGNIIKVEVLRDTGIYDISRFEYDNLDRKIQSIMLVDEADLKTGSDIPNISELRDSEYSGKVKLITSYEYDILGNVVKVVDPRAYGYLISDTANRDKFTTWYTYDSLNRLEKVKRKHNGVDVYTQYYYDVNGNVEKIVNERGFSTEYTYDEMNRVKTIKDAKGKAMTYTYDKAGNLKTQTNAKNYAVTYNYDSLNRLETTQDPYEKVINKKLYDANGNIVKEIDGRGYLLGTTDETRYGTSYTYDIGNRLVKVVDPEIYALNDKTKFTEKYEYNQYGEKTKIINALGEATNYEYDDAGRLVKVIDDLKVETVYAYNKRGNKLSMKDGRGKTTSYTYGAHGILISVKDANGRISKYKYDLGLNMASLVDRNGNETVYTHDLKNQLLSRKVLQTGDSVTYTYDEAGNRKSMTDASGTIEYTYDVNNRLLNIKKSGKDQIVYTYDDIGNIDTITDKAGFVITYKYDKASRMEKVTYKVSGASKTITYVYDANGNRESINYSDGMKVSYTYDKNNRLKTLVNKNPSGGIVSTYSCEYDLAGRQKSKTDSFGTTTYNYDKVGRILSINAPGKTSVYTYDNAGNRLTLNETYTSEQSTGYTDETTKSQIKFKIKSSQYIYSDTNELLMLVESMKDSKGKEVVRKTISYSYDKNGNQISQQTSFTKAYTPVKEETFGIVVEGATEAQMIDSHTEIIVNKFDGFNRLKKVEATKAGVKAITEFVYNGDDLRVKKTVKKSSNNYSSEVTNYYYDRQHVILETNGSDNVKSRYIRGINYIARLDASNKLSYFMYNDHGDVVQTVSETGEVENSYDYDIWGNPVLTVQQYDCAIRYAGEFYDSETGLYYLRARYYDPYIGRFISEDSYWGEDTNPLSLNLYTYCYNDPIRFIDPTGHFVWGKGTVLKQGDNNSDVEQLQKMLIKLGFLSEKNEKNESNIDGKFGGITAAAVKKFKASHGGLGDANNSNVGDTTWMYLERDYKASLARDKIDRGDIKNGSTELAAANKEFNERYSILFPPESSKKQTNKPADPNPNKNNDNKDTTSKTEKEPVIEEIYYIPDNHSFIGIGKSPTVNGEYKYYPTDVRGNIIKIEQLTHEQQKKYWTEYIRFNGFKLGYSTVGVFRIASADQRLYDEYASYREVVDEIRERYAEYIEKAKIGQYQTLMGLVIAGTSVIGLTATIEAATAGTATPAVLAILGAVDVYNILYGTALAIEGAQNWYYGETQSDNTGLNFMRDGVFLGFDDVYETFSAIVNIVGLGTSVGQRIYAFKQVQKGIVEVVTPEGTFKINAKELKNINTIDELIDSGELLLNNSTKGTGKTFYTVQSETDAARLMNGGNPWPTAESRSALGEGVYAWGTKEEATNYLNLIQKRNPNAKIIEFTVSDADLANLKSLNIDLLPDAEIESFMSQYSKLWGGTPNHGLEYIQRGTNMGTEHFFDKSIIDLLKFKQ